MNHEFRNIDPRQTRILLIEGGPRVLPAYSEELSRKAEDQLRRLGVEVRTSRMVNRIEPGAVWVGDERIPAARNLMGGRRCRFASRPKVGCSD